MTALGDDLLATVNKLQDLVFNTIGNDSLDLPQIVVVGSQSSGKSSVLENIVGRDFLPRGSGICTRRPLILQLINVPQREGEGEPPEWGEFHHQPGRKYEDFAAVKQEIDNETARIAGSNKGINRQPINLKIFSPHLLNLTLVDLPGLTKVPIGDQPSDIEKQTRNLISEYIAKPNSIILAVSPANVDLVNSEALKLARHVDPMGKRTIGVLTKLDLMDHGTNAMDILSGRVYPLKLGFIGVVNRSQQDIQSGKSLREALQAEQEFFRNHPAYRNISLRCGTHFLAKTLNTTLMTHIRERLPDIKARLNTLMGQTQQELASYGNKQFAGPEHRGSLILQLMTRFASSFISSIDGTSMEISTKELCGGARVYYIFNSVFGNALETIDPTQNLTVMDIRTAIRNSTGPRPSLFVPELAFDLLVKPQIKLLEIPSQRCVELVYEELIKVCHNCGSQELSRFPRLQAKLIEVVSDLLRERLGPCSQYVESLIAIQRAYINTNHPNFLGAAAAMSSVMQARQDRERRAALSEEKKKRERRRLREMQLNDELPDPDDDAASTVNGDVTAAAYGGRANGEKALPVRSRHHHSKSGRSDSPHIFRNLDPNAAAGGGGEHRSSLAASFSNGNGRSSSFSNAAAAAAGGVGGGGGGGAKDSFLNYFFGKDGSMTPPVANANANANLNAAATSSPGLGSARDGFQSSNVATTQRPGSRLEANTGTVVEKDEFGGAALVGSGFEGELAGLQSDEPQLTEREALESELIRKLISSYFNIVRETIADQVPKAIMHLLVNHSKEVVQNRLVTELYKEDLFPELLYEDDSIKAEREKCEKLLATYKEAAKIVGEVL